MRNLLVFAVLLVTASPVPAQQSPGYRLREGTFNEGGHPAAGLILTSAGFKVRLDAIGDSMAPTALIGADFHLESGFLVAFRPPGEVMNLRFDADGVTLRWDPERSVGSYNLYRDRLSALRGLASGSCLISHILGQTAVDPDLPSPDDGFFYLVTARNRIAEEGTKGYDSSGTPRANPAPCP